jgi:hypothetical protein
MKLKKLVSYSLLQIQASVPASSVSDFQKAGTDSAYGHISVGFWSQTDTGRRFTSVLVHISVGSWHETTPVTSVAVLKMN